MKHLLTIVLSLTFVVGIAQNEEDDKRVKPVEGDWGFVLNMTGLIDQIGLNTPNDALGQSTILARYYSSDDLVFRLGLGFNTINRTQTTKDSIGLSEVTVDSTFKKSNFTFTLGIEKHLGTTRRLDPYIGVELALSTIGKTNIDKTTTDKVGSNESKTEIIYTEDGGIGFGINGIVGFNYFVAERFALGAEYRLGYLYVKEGGNFSETTTFTPINGNATTSFREGENTSKASSLNIQGDLNLTLSYYFGN